MAQLALLGVVGKAGKYVLNDKGAMKILPEIAQAGTEAPSPKLLAATAAIPGEQNSNFHTAISIHIHFAWCSFTALCYLYNNNE